ncbi:MAG: hypothetical protein HYS26_00410 [Candidatus Kaiserbacteria bacterium]|nr:MAG: hypothetical protein HYS26_00410 [Candidatus Kaiserbacteria bacterium]
MSLRLALALSTFSIVLFGFALVATAQVNVAEGVDQMCINYFIQCQANPPCLPKPCTTTAAGKTVTGTCTPIGCKGTGFQGLSGGMQGIQGLDQFMGILGKIKELLGGGGKGGGGGGSPATGGGAAGGAIPGQSGCTQYYQVTVPSSDPCAYYVPPATASVNNPLSSNSTDGLLSALGGSTGSSLGAAFGDEESTPVNVSQNLLNITTGGSSQQPTTQTSTGGTQTSSLAGQSTSLQPTTQGDIRVLDSGATVIANARDPQTNTEIAGFYGGSTFGTTQPQGVVATLCTTRPWSNSVVSFIIPPSFFDSLCSWRGYQVGLQPQVAQQTQNPSVQLTQQTTPAQGSTQAPAQQQTVVPPEVDIWAAPASVALGSRTSVFWNTKGVTSCAITSSDGNFTEDELSGGASTVPLSGATTFTIECTAPDGTKVKDETTVNIAI